LIDGVKYNDMSIIEKLQKQIEEFTPSESLAEDIGVVVSVGDGVAEIEGLPKAVMSEMIIFETATGKSVEEALKDRNKLYGVVLNLERHSMKVVVLGDTQRIKEGMIAKATGEILSVPVGEALVGRVVDALGAPLDGLGKIDTDTMFPIERPSHGVIERQAVNYPVHTGTIAIDAMTPIGRGQRQLVIGDRHTGKTVIALDLILNQRNEPKEKRPICIFVAIGQKESKIAKIVARLKQAGAMEYTVVVDASASSPASLQYLAPFAGASIGEYFMERGRDAVIIYDDLSKHAVAYRQLSLLLRRPPGREAYPGDIFYLHSRLLERAARLSEKKGGGSLTAIPIIETKEGDVSAYIPTNVISITDGQIFLDTDLFNKGVRPAMDVGISVSRVGSSAQTKAMKKVAGKMRLELAQYRELEAFVQFASDLDPDTKARIEKGARLVEVLKQYQHEPIPFEEQSILIFSANNGFFDAVEVGAVVSVVKQFLQFFRDQHSDILSKIRDSRELSEETEKQIAEGLKLFQLAHKNTSN
jgi:F-type H+/Na+-transporting ATPase subunit alpha